MSEAAVEFKLRRRVRGALGIGEMMAAKSVRWDDAREDDDDDDEKECEVGAGCGGRKVDGEIVAQRLSPNMIVRRSLACQFLSPHCPCLTQPQLKLNI